MKRIIGIILLLALTNAVYAETAPEEAWNKTFGGDGGERAWSVQQTSDGGYIIAGDARSYGAGGSDFWLVKTDSNGNKVWDKTFGGTAGDEAYDVQQTSDNGYILAGRTGSYGAGNGNFWLVKTDSKGNEQWNRTFSGTGPGEAESVQQTSDGGYILAGRTDSCSDRGFDFWLVKTDSNGNKTWDKTYGGTGRDTAYSVQQTSDRGYILAGATYSYGAGGSDFSDVWLVKTDSNGNKAWDKTFGGTARDEAYDVQQTSDGGYILAGQISSYGAGSWDFWLIKVGGVYTPTPTGSISVSSAPSGADIYLDGAYKGTTPATISDVTPGSHALKLEKYGYEEWLTSVQVTSGVTKSITAHLAHADVSPPAIRIDKPATIDQNNNSVLEEGEKVEITYGANDPSGVASIKILLGGTLLESQNQAGTYTMTTSPLSVGTHTIRVEATDSKSNSGFEELPITVERTGPSVYFGTTRTTINKGEDAIFTLSAVNPIGNPPMTVQLILKPPSGVSVTSSSFAKSGSGIYTCTQTIESGDNVRSIEVHLTGNEVGTHEIESEVYYQFEGSPKSPTRYETLTLVVEPDTRSADSESEAREIVVPGFGAMVAVMGLLAVYL
jgi:hypothetical protein